MAGVPLATAFVRIVPDTAGFATKLKAETAAASPVITPRVNTAPAEGKIKGFINDIGGKLIGALAIGEVLKTGLEVNSDYQKGLAQLQAGLKSTGNVAGLTAGDMEKLADKISNYSGQNRATIVGTEQLLIAFRNVRDEAGKGSDIFTRATKAAADMAARMGGDASDQARKLGRALDDPIHGLTLLTRSGVTFTDGQKALIKSLVESGHILDAQKVILDQLEVKYGGSAKAVGDTLPGEINKAKNTFKELSGEIVGAVGPAFDLLVKGVVDVGKAFGAGVHFLEEHKKAVIAVTAAYAALKWQAIAGAIADFASNVPVLLGRVVGKAGEAAASLRALGAGSLASGALLSGFALGGVGLLTYGLLNLGKASADAKAHVRELLSGLDLSTLSGLDAAINKLTDDLHTAATKFSSSIIGGGSAQLGQDAKTLAGLQAAKTAVQELAKEYGVSTDAVSAFAKANGVDLTQGLQKVEPEFRKLLGLNSSWFDSTTNNLAKLKLANAALAVSLSDALSGQSNIDTFLNNQTTAFTNLANAQDGLKTAQQDLVTKQQAYGTALHDFGATSDQAKTAYNDLQTAVKGVATAQQTLDQAQPPTVASILKKLGLDDTTLNQLTAAAQKLQARGLSGQGFSELLSLNDPRAILAFANGPQSAIGQLNNAVSKFFSDSGPQSFTSLQKQFKDGGTKGIQAWATGVNAARQVANDAYVSALVDPVKKSLSQIITISSKAGSQIPDNVASRMLASQQKVLDAALATFPVPVQKAINQAVLNIEAGRAPAITQTQAFADGINAQTAKILTSLGITITTDDQASQKIRDLQTLINTFNQNAKAAGFNLALPPVGVSAPGVAGSAAGGLITGPGSGTSDSILRWLSNGEYVVPEATVKQLGVGFFDSLRGMAAGGLVRPSERLSGQLDLEGVIGSVSPRITGLAGAGGVLPSGDAVNRWAPLVLSVLGMLGQSASWLPNVLRQIATESGGNPSAINLWDSNAAVGQPSQGLLQTIPATFAGNAGPYIGLGIDNPLANIYAALHYALGRYGTLGILGQGHGYDNGGALMPGWTMAYNGTGKPENVQTAAQAEHANRSAPLLHIEHWHGDQTDAQGLAQQLGAQQRAYAMARGI